jgi:hypothetical protein
MGHFPTAAATDQNPDFVDTTLPPLYIATRIFHGRHFSSVAKMVSPIADSDSLHFKSRISANQYLLRLK